MPQDPTDDKSTLVQVMAWCRHKAPMCELIKAQLCTYASAD